MKELAFSILLLFAVVIWKSGHESRVTFSGDYQFCEYCKKKNLDSNLRNWAQRAVYDKDTGKSYSKYLCKGDYGKTYILLKEDKSKKMTIREIK